MPHGHLGHAYLDHAATSPLRGAVLEAMAPYFAERSANPASLHQAGQAAKRAVDEARDAVAGCLGARPEEIIFTSGGTEGDNLAVVGAALAARDRGRHVITTQIEHHAVLHAAESLEGLGFDVTYLTVDGQGVVDLDALAAAMRGDTVLVSVMLANNEVGTVQPVAEVARLAHARGAAVHTDAVQALGKWPVDVNELGVDLLVLTAHKLGGPKGAGALYVRRGTPITPLLRGGGQERSLRPGTLNVPGIVGLAAAMRAACAELEEEAARLRGLRDRLEAGLGAALEGVALNGHPTQRLPNIANLSFEGVSGESLLMALDVQGVAVSTGSACAAGSTEPSHVLTAMGLGDSRASSALRYSLGHSTTEEEIELSIGATVKAVVALRRMSPVGDRSEVYRVGR